MSLLLDTHVFLWLAGERGRDPDFLVDVREEVDDVFVSAASIWEIAIKRALGRLDVRASTIEMATTSGFELLPITPEHAERAGGLPRHHRDPFDRMLVAQATIEGLTLVTADRTLEAYGVPLRLV